MIAAGWRLIKKHKVAATLWCLALIALMLPHPY